MTIIGSTNTGVTLSPASPDVTITGLIAASGVDIFTYNGAQDALIAAVQAPTGAAFDIQNLGVIETIPLTDNNAYAAAYVGIFLRQPGIVSNAGTIASSNALIMSGYGGGGYIKNTGLIKGAIATGIALEGAGGISNTGTIAGVTDAIFLYNGGLVTNTGTIAGGTGIYANQSARIQNYGLIQGKYLNGAYLTGAITNARGATIAGGEAGIAIGGGVITNNGLITGENGPGILVTGLTAIDNTGTIATSGGDSIFLESAAQISNAGLIEDWVQTSPYGSATILNNGTIGLAVGALVIDNARRALLGGADLTAGYLRNAGLMHYVRATQGYVIIVNTGTITSAPIAGIAVGDTGVELETSAPLINSGTIIGTSAGVEDLADPATIVNTGTIMGQNIHKALADGIELANNGGTIIDSGLIAGTNGGDAIAFGYGNNHLVLTPTATISGAVALNGGLSLNAGATAGALTLASFHGLDVLAVKSGADWDLLGPASTSAAIANSGTLTAESAVTLSGAITGKGTIALETSLTLAGRVAARQAIALSGTHETLTLTTPQKFAATIQNFTLADTINLATIPLASITGETLLKNILTLTESTTTLTFTFASLPLHDTFALTQSGPGTALTLTTQAAGTQPLTHPLTPAQIPTLTLQP